MRRWQLIVIPIAVFFIVLVSGILVINFVIDKPSDNKNPSESPSSSSEEPSNNESSASNNEFNPKKEYANYLSTFKTNFDEKNVRATVVVGAKEYTVNSLITDNGTELIEFTDNKNGFSIYTLSDAVYMYTSNTIDGEIINSWAKTEKSDDYKALTRIDDYFSVKNLENQLKNSDTAEYDKTVEENGTTYDILTFKIAKDEQILDTFNLELTDEDITEQGVGPSQAPDVDDEENNEEGEDTSSEDGENNEEDDVDTQDNSSNDDVDYMEYSVYVNRKTKEIEKVVFNTNDYKATVYIQDANTINLPNGAEIAEEISQEDFEFLLLGVKMAIVGSNE